MSNNFSLNIDKFYNLAKYKLYPICRSLTGKGTLDTLKIIKKEFLERAVKITLYIYVLL